MDCRPVPVVFNYPFSNDPPMDKHEFQFWSRSQSQIPRGDRSHSYNGIAAIVIVIATLVMIWSVSG